MKYKSKFSKQETGVLVPQILCDEHLKIYTSAQLKVILYLFGNEGKAFSEEEIAETLRLDLQEVNDSLLYWSACSIIEEENTAQTQPEKFIPSFTAGQPEKPSKPAVSENMSIPSKPSQSEILQRIEEQEEIGLLFNEAQAKLGKTIGYDGQCTLLLLLDHYGLPVDVIYMLLEYCRSVGKTNYAYIEAVGRDWGIKEIDTIDKAAARMESLHFANAAWARFSAFAGLKNPKPTAKQAEYLDLWLNQWSFTPEMIEKAYEEMVQTTGKLNFGYMNKILLRWHTEGKLSLDAVNKEIEEKRSNLNKENKSNTNKNAYRTPAEKNLDSGSGAGYDLNKFIERSKKPIKYERKNKS